MNNIIEQWGEIKLRRTGI